MKVARLLLVVRSTKILNINEPYRSYKLGRRVILVVPKVLV